MRDLTKPPHKFWEKEQCCKSALINYVNKLNNDRFNLEKKSIKDFEIVKFNLVEEEIINV